MSRTEKGTKGPGYEFWSKRPLKGSCLYSGPEAKKVTHKMERQEAKPLAQPWCDDCGALLVAGVCPFCLELEIEPLEESGEEEIIYDEEE